MLAKLQQSQSPFSDVVAKRARHVLVVLPQGVAAADLRSVPYGDSLQAALERRSKKLESLSKSPLMTESAGALVSWLIDDTARSTFERQTLVRKALQPLLAEQPAELVLAVFGEETPRAASAELALYAAWVNGASMPVRKKKDEAKPLGTIRLFGARDPGGYPAVRAKAEGNVLARTLTVLPPNELTPGAYRTRLRELAKDEGWSIEELDMKRLRRMGAGAFVAVAQGSDVEDAAIVRLRYRPRGAVKTVALVGKGICFDTGGHNLKPAQYMIGMHGDMNGSAVALGILFAATHAKVPVAIDCWLALAQNHIGPRAYKQNDVITALDGTTIEIVHTDAEGRMVLSDTLTLSARDKPDLILSFATLTGSMKVALGNRYSGIFATSEDVARQALNATAESGERVCVFPMDDDYEEALESAVADVKQCTLEGGGDHILAARLLKRFTAGLPWIHMDLSAAGMKGGLGAVATDVTGFGVSWGYALLRSLGKR